MMTPDTSTIDSSVLIVSILIAFIAAVPPTIAALAAYRRAQQSYSETQKLHVQVNHKMDQLLELTRATAHAAGVKDEQERRITEEMKEFEGS